MALIFRGTHLSAVLHCNEGYFISIAGLQPIRDYSIKEVGEVREELNEIIRRVEAKATEKQE